RVSPPACWFHNSGRGPPGGTTARGTGAWRFMPAGRRRRGLVPGRVEGGGRFGTVRRGTWLILAGAVLWGTTGTAQALAPAGATPAVIGALRLAVGAAVLLVVAAARRDLARLRGWPVLPTVLAAAGVAAYQLAFFAGVAATGVAVGTMAAIGSSPVFAGLLAWLVRGGRPAPRWYPSTALAVTGAALLALSAGQVEADVVGILLALGAGAAYAAYAVASKNVLDTRGPDAAMAVIFSGAALLLAPLLPGADLSWALSPRGAGVILHLGLITIAVAYRLYAQGLTTVPVSTAVTLSLAEPLTAALLGIAVLGERPTV